MPRIIHQTHHVKADDVITGATVRAGQTAVHPIGVLRVGLSVLTGMTDAIFLISFTFLVHKGSYKSDTKTQRQQLSLRYIAKNHITVKSLAQGFGVRIKVDKAIASLFSTNVIK